MAVVTFGKCANDDVVTRASEVFVSATHSPFVALTDVTRPSGSEGFLERQE